MPDPGYLFQPDPDAPAWGWTPLGVAPPPDQERQPMPKERPLDPVVEALRLERIRQRLSQRLIAERIGVAQNVICNWECGRSSPMLHNVRRWAESLDLDLRAVRPLSVKDAALAERILDAVEGKWDSERPGHRPQRNEDLTEPHHDLWHDDDIKDTDGR